jgi:hypothetical protein
MEKTMFKRVAALTLASVLALVGCADSGGPSREKDEEDDEVVAGDADLDAATSSEDAVLPSTRDTDAASASTSDAGAGSPGQGMQGAQGMQGEAGSAGGDAGAPQSGPSECATRAKDECDYQKMCDPVGFAREWDGDINQFCIPKRKAACEKNLPISRQRAAGDACNAWVRQSCDNYRNLYYPIFDSNMKWQYGSPACEAMVMGARENRAIGDDCSADYQCKPGLFCKTADDDWMSHGDPGVEYICGKCAAQYAYDGPITFQALETVNDVCYRADMCKGGYECLRAYGTDNTGSFGSLSYERTGNREDYQFCLKTISKAGVDKPCATKSNVRCDDGLVCEPTVANGIVGACKVPASATIPTYVGKDARCDPALCDRRLHLQCKPVQVNGMSEKRCVQDAIVAIGGFCKNQSKEDVAECSQFARCAEGGQCVRRNLENESCFANITTPGANDRGSCDSNVFDEHPLVCRQDNGELSTFCHKALPQAMCATR